MSSGPATTSCRWATPLRELIEDYGGGVWRGPEAQGDHPRRLIHATV